MNKKSKKRLLVINKKLHNLRQQLSGAREQDDEPGEIQQIELDIDRFELEARELKAS
ncbi:MAG: hypothetical protein VB855_12035 [Pirellulaceae bacterium]